MANKTIPNNRSVVDFINAVEHPKRKKDAFLLLEWMQELTGQEAVMWGDSIVGFGSYHYKYDSGREGDMPLVGFSPRKAKMVVYIMPGFARFNDLLEQLGPYKTGSSCLYMSTLDKVDHDILKELIKRSFTYMNQKYN
ncbi:MAG: DUF1801 domain-containing protein [Crocinitomicaceae bacterium]|jgi:hypothetical protein|nr:DUF1801 domain-containing protein [Crocinitomicaceae bacterium]